MDRWIVQLVQLSSILDNIATGKPTIADQFNVIFVPIVNIDGYDITWSGNRYQRKNANQVDLNRNFLSFYKNPRPPSPSDEAYPGPFPLSELETKGIADWLKANNDGIAGWVDVHAYAGLILFPYGDTLSPIGGGEDEKFQLLGRNVQARMGPNYKAETSATLYPAYGCFDDYHYRMYKKPVLTLEIAGSDFVAPASTIRTRGTEVFNGLTQFAQEVITYNGGATPQPTTTKLTPSTTTLAPMTTSPVPTTSASPVTTKPTTSPVTTAKPTTNPTANDKCDGNRNTCFWPATRQLLPYSQSDCELFTSFVWCP
ncbi:hypothetical protein DYB30_011560 [Aphanomyces astaci]|uniref:Peptidase M14 domain-containing protein n=1 Tax=Aphanomyces astaci TaxID=112090 RepID=A0A397C7Z8_APHAT|nr:hypothetical protein DYB30_011560 [Aphanomyces astaci]RHY72891.1 hypothetical protein DYB34_013279 [Aphanomyces astaci]